jgi:2-polyprenyl-6-hydroxyphenyl methylase/3-demethylubiquinone-9 3-methyltransferase
MYNVDPIEIAKFSVSANHWWDTQGQFRTLHDINPLRLDYINKRSPLAGQKVIDIGCGGGILAEGMVKLGAQVTGIDMSKEALSVAKLHQIESELNIEYLHTTAEEIAQERAEQYDIVTCLEMLEHVPDPTAIVKACAHLVKPGGHVFFSTLNRSLKAYLFAIVGAEYILKLLPRQTHDFAKFIRPSELSEWSRQCGLTVKNMTGIQYNPFNKKFSLNEDISVNYLMHVVKNI